MILLKLISQNIAKFIKFSQKKKYIKKFIFFEFHYYLLYMHFTPPDTFADKKKKNIYKKNSK